MTLQQLFSFQYICTCTFIQWEIIFVRSLCFAKKQKLAPHISNRLYSNVFIAIVAHEVKKQIWGHILHYKTKEKSMSSHTQTGCLNDVQKSVIQKSRPGHLYSRYSQLLCIKVMNVAVISRFYRQIRLVLPGPIIHIQ